MPTENQKKAAELINKIGACNEYEYVEELKSFGDTGVYINGELDECLSVDSYDKIINSFINGYISTTNSNDGEDFKIEVH